MPATYDKIATYTASGSVATYTFNTIAGTYTDLVMVVNGGVASGNPSIYLRFNGDTATNYSYTRVTGNGTSALSSREANRAFAIVASAFGMTTTFETNLIIQIMNYANATTFKSIVSRANTPSLGTEASVNLWRATPAAITSIEIYNSSAVNFAAGSTFTLYGIKAA